MCRVAGRTHKTIHHCSCTNAKMLIRRSNPSNFVSACRFSLWAHYLFRDNISCMRIRKTFIFLFYPEQHNRYDLWQSTTASTMLMIHKNWQSRFTKTISRFSSIELMQYALCDYVPFECCIEGYGRCSMVNIVGWSAAMHTMVFGCNILRNLLEFQRRFELQYIKNKIYSALWYCGDSWVQPICSVDQFEIALWHTHTQTRIAFQNGMDAIELQTNYVNSH